MSNTKTDELNVQIKKMFTDATPLTEDDLKSFGKKNREIMKRPSFKAGVLKDQIKHTILEAMDANNINQSKDKF